jgi:hypothetical protein
MPGKPGMRINAFQPVRVHSILPPLGLAQTPPARRHIAEANPHIAHWSFEAHSHLGPGSPKLAQPHPIGRHIAEAKSYIAQMSSEAGSRAWLASAETHDPEVHSIPHFAQPPFEAESQSEPGAPSLVQIRPTDLHIPEANRHIAPTARQAGSRSPRLLALTVALQERQPLLLRPTRTPPAPAFAAGSSKSRWMPPSIAAEACALPMWLAHRDPSYIRMVYSAALKAP